MTMIMTVATYLGLFGVSAFGGVWLGFYCCYLLQNTLEEECGYGPCCFWRPESRQYQILIYGSASITTIVAGLVVLMTITQVLSVIVSAGILTGMFSFTGLYFYIYRHHFLRSSSLWTFLWNCRMHRESVER